MSTLLDSGELTVWRGANTAPPGGMPTMGYSVVYQGAYGEKTVGITRWYTGQQHGDRPDIVVQIQRTYGLVAGSDLVTLAPYTHQDPKPYKINQIQQVINAENLPMTDLTLQREDGIDANDLTAAATA